MDYKTKQREAIFSYIQQQKNRYVTVSELLHALKESGTDIGLTTVYRHLEKLEAKGIICKYHINGSNAACYKAVDKEAEKFLLKCEVCGRLVRFSCRDLENLYKHFNRAHNYAINPYKTVFYGRCDRCKEGQNA